MIRMHLFDSLTLRPIIRREPKSSLLHTSRIPPDSLKRQALSSSSAYLIIKKHAFHSPCLMHDHLRLHMFLASLTLCSHSQPSSPIISSTSISVSHPPSSKNFPSFHKPDATQIHRRMTTHDIFLLPPSPPPIIPERILLYKERLAT